MTQARQWKLSPAQRADMWNRWKAGQSLHAIGRALGKDHVVIQFLLARHGGIAPPTRRRWRRALTLAEREDISRRIASGCWMRVIAQHLSRARSTVSREVARGCASRCSRPVSDASPAPRAGTLTPSEKNISPWRSGWVSGASRRATTNSLGTTSQPCASLPPWHSGFDQLSLDPREYWDALTDNS